jgi:hypothetical protein
MTEMSGAGRLVFTPRPAPVSPRLRPARRVALLLELIDKCRGGRATLLQLHALDTAVVDPAARSRLAGERNDGPYPVVRIDPALNSALDRAIGYGLVALRSDALVELTQTGREWLSHIRESDLFEGERQAIGEIPGRLTQTAVRNATGGSR